MKIHQHPLFLAGFRPFFIFAMISGALLPLLWALSFSGKLALVFSHITPLQWHVHEMLFGFGWAVLGGFLLTASKNWVKIRGIHGAWLCLAALLWLLERVGVCHYGELPGALNFLVVNAFILFVAGYILWTLIYYRKQDSFKDNFFFVIILPLFIVAKNLIFSPENYLIGWSMSIGLFRVAFVVMLERTLTQFMKNSMSENLLRNPYLDYGIKIFAVLAVFESLMPAQVAATVLALAGGLLGLRFFLWKPLKGLSTFGIGVSYAGYFGLTLHFLLEAIQKLNLWQGVGALSVHVFTFLCMGIIIPAMLIRICQGHTGRKLAFTTSDRWAIGAMGAGAFFRLVATQLWPGNYLNWILLAGIGWSLCFILIAYRLTPFLVKARLDGKEH